MFQRLKVAKMKVFFIIWFGQFISLIGSGLTEFALGVWVYQRTGSVTQFALISLFTTLPPVLVSPVAGALVDRWNRRWVMILSDTGAGLMTLTIAILLAMGRLEIWHIYITNTISSTFNAFQLPAYTAATTLLVPKRNLGRASGMIQLEQAAARVFSPMLAGVLLVSIQLQGIILLDFITFFFALITLINVRFPRAKTTTAEKNNKNSLLQEIAYGWNFIMARPGLLGLLIFFTINNFLLAVVSVLATPLVLSFASISVLGTILSLSGIGMLVGSLVMSTWGGPNRHINAVFGFMFLGGLCILTAGLRPSVPLFTLSAFLFFFCLPIVSGSNQVIFQKKVPFNMQGRIFALNRTIQGVSIPVAYIVAGPLADYFFEPFMASNNLIASSIRVLIGSGSGRGMGLMFVLMGIFTILVVVVAYHYPRLRFLEDEIPDQSRDNP